MENINNGDFTERILLSISELNKRLIERDELIRLVTLAILSRSHMFLIGERGVGKSLAIRLFSNLIKDVKYWELLVGSDTEPKQLFGEKRISENGTVYYEAKNTVLDSHIVFLDEMFKANNEVLNTTLQIMADRYYTTGDGRMVKVPLISMIGASNEYPSGSLIEPFVDRIIFWYEVKRIQDPQNRRKYFQSLFDKTPIEKPLFTLDDIDYIKEKAIEVTIPKNVLLDIESIIDSFLIQGVKTSDRKFLNAIEQAMRTSAFLNNRNVLDESDVFLFLFSSWQNDVEKRKVYETVYFHYFFNTSSFEKILEEIKKNTEESDTYVKGELYDLINYLINFIGEETQKDYEIQINRVAYVLKKYSDTYEDVRRMQEKIANIYRIESLIVENIFLGDIKNNSLTEKILNELEHYESVIASEYTTLKNWYDKNNTLADYKKNQQMERSDAY